MTQHFILSQPFEAILNNEFFTRLWLSNIEPLSLSDERFISIITKYGFLSELVLYHINKLSEDEINQLIIESTLLTDLIKSSTNDYITEFHFNELIKFIKKDNLLYLGAKLEIITHEQYSRLTVLILDRIAIEHETTLDELAMYIDLHDSVTFIHHDDLVNVWSKWQLAQSFRTNINNMLDMAKKLSGIEYEIIDNNLIAYKGMNKDGSSTMSAPVIYEVGKTYYADFCDEDMHNDNSYGLSAWDKKLATNYCPEKVVKVKIPLHAIRYIGIRDGKIRTKEFTVIEDVTE